MLISAESELAERLTPVAEWLVATYEIADWPQCWVRHPGFVLTLDALWVWHEGARAGGSPSDLFLWHEALDRFCEKARALERRCGGRCSVAGE